MPRRILSQEIEKNAPSFSLAGAFKTGDQAWSFLEKEEVDILITDIKMPGMSGLELAERALARWPDMVVSIITGYSEFEYARQAIMLGVSSFLLKPINLKEFADALTHMGRQRFERMVIISFIVLSLLNVRSGVVNQVLAALGGKKIQWYSRAQYWPYILTLVHEWASVGMGCILYYATLMGVDEGLFEAAMLDGANRRQQLWHVAIPHLVPVIMIKLILGMGSIFQGDFGLFYQVPRNIGLLYRTTDVINTYVFRAMMGGDLEKSAAIGLFQSLVGMAMVILTNLIVRKVSPEQSLF